jgi:hypothetical protein
MPVAGLAQRDILAEAADWATQNRDVLLEVGDAFLDDDWPKVDALGRAALRRRDPRDYFTLLRSIPGPLGLVTPENGRPAGQGRRPGAGSDKRRPH